MINKILFKGDVTLIKSICKSKFYSQFDSSKLLKEVQENINPSVVAISEEFQFVFHKILHTDPCSYWNKEVYNQTESLLELLFQTYGDKLEIDETIFNYFLMGYDAYCQISETILDLRNFNVSQQIKTSLYRLPVYTSILERCLSNFLRVITNLTGKSIKKDYSTQNTLGQLISVIKANGYNEIVKNVNVNLRNAINHGKVLLKKTPTDKISFFYVENHISKCIEMALYEFDKIIDDTFDTVSAVLLSLITFMNNHMKLLHIDESKSEHISFSLLAMRLSIPGICCQRISDTRNSKQLNVEIEITNTDRTYIAQIATILSILVFDKYNNYEQYMFSFSNPRMINGWVRYKNQEILDMVNNIKSFDAVFIEVRKRNDFVIFNPSTENVDLNEIKYFCFPNYNSKSFKINNVQDVSTEQRKRLRANLYIGTITTRQEILNVINQAVEWLRKVKNPPSPVILQKHGDMPADSLYINVYRSDGRKSKELYTSNENFICFVDYNADGTTSLKNGGLPKSLWNVLHHEKLDNMFIAWKDGKYITRQVVKIGRNDPCPCGSGLKYKKCCGST